MDGIDTNILVRFLVQDDPGQCAIVDEIMQTAIRQRASLFVSVIVLCERVWVLDSSYKVEKHHLVETLERILREPYLMVEKHEDAATAVSRYKHGKGDFADYLLGATNQTSGCSQTYTFDRKLMGTEGFTVLS